MSIKNSNDTIGNRTRELLACSAVPQPTAPPRVPIHIQGGAEPTDTFQMVIDNIWKQGKISETVYKYSKYAIYYPQITSLFSEHQADGLRLHQCIVASVSGSCRTRASVGPHQ